MRSRNVRLRPKHPYAQPCELNLQNSAQHALLAKLPRMALSSTSTVCGSMHIVHHKDHSRHYTPRLRENTSQAHTCSLSISWRREKPPKWHLHGDRMCADACAIAVTHVPSRVQIRSRHPVSHSRAVSPFRKQYCARRVTEPSPVQACSDSQSNPKNGIKH